MDMLVLALVLSAFLPMAVVLVTTWTMLHMYPKHRHRG